MENASKKVKKGGGEKRKKKDEKSIKRGAVQETEEKMKRKDQRLSFYLKISKYFQISRFHKKSQLIMICTVQCAY